MYPEAGLMRIHVTACSDLTYRVLPTLSLGPSVFPERQDHEFECP